MDRTRSENNAEKYWFFVVFAPVIYLGMILAITNS